MTVLWLFSYNSIVKYHGKKLWEPLNLVTSKSVLQQSVIKGLHCASILLTKSAKVTINMTNRRRIMWGHSQKSFFEALVGA